MATVTFKAKAKILHDGDQVVDMFDIPKLDRKHCDMSAFRKHPRLGFLSNSDMFPGAVNKQVRELYPAGYIRADRLRDNTTITAGFLHTITIEL